MSFVRTPLVLSICATILLGTIFNNCAKFQSTFYQELGSQNQNGGPITDPSEEPNDEPNNPQPTIKKHYLYLALQGSNTIETYSINAADGKLTKTASVSAVGGILPLAIHPNKKYLYAGLSTSRSVSAYRINQDNGQLSFEREVNVGLSPVYIHIDSQAKNLLIPSYADSAITVLPLQGDGGLSANTSDREDTGTNAHSAITSQSSQFVFVPNTNSNTISQFSFNANTGQLNPNSAEPEVVAPVGAGPRHVVHHPTLDIIYFVNEPGDSVTVYSVDKATGRLSAQQTITTLPDTANPAGNTCADIHMTPDRKFIYASNRGHNSLAIFSVGSNGTLTAVGHQLVTGVPREFEIDPTGKYIYVAGLTANKLSSFSINAQTGLLTPIEMFDTMGSPLWVYSLELP